MYIVGRYVNRGWNSANNPNSPGKVSGQDGQKAPCKEVRGEHGDGLSHREHPILAINFIYWVMVHGIADSTFKGILSVNELLAQRPPEGGESWTL
jgi:hypothetical protein